MTLYTKPLDNAIILKNAASSPGAGYTAVSNVQAAVDQARTAGVPLFVSPGTYQTTELYVTGGQAAVPFCI